jgi:hypothetical protein
MFSIGHHTKLVLLPETSSLFTLPLERELVTLPVTQEFIVIINDMEVGTDIMHRPNEHNGSAWAPWPRQGTED